MATPPYRRRNLRLPEFDYTTPGTYFITICIQSRACVLGEVVDGEIALSAVGEMVARHLQLTIDRFSDVELDAYVIMPNHVHLLLNLGWRAHDPNMTEAEGEQPSTPTSLGQIAHWFKSATTNEYIWCVRTRGWPRFPGQFWQDNYHDHVVRDDLDLDRIRTYIMNNPAKWEFDSEYQPTCRGF